MIFIRYFKRPINTRLRAQRTLYVVLAVCMILVLFLVLVPETKTKTITISESLSEGNDIPPAEEDAIYTTGFWNQQIIGISYSTSELSHSKEASEIMFSAITGTGSYPYLKNFTGWHIIFHSVLAFGAKDQIHLVLAEEQDASIKVRLTNEKHPANKIGSTVLSIDKNTSEIISADITIFEADRLYELGVLQDVAIHEIGHALGLGHSNVQEGVMFPSVRIDNATLYEIGSCEFTGLKMLYYDHKVSKQIDCEG